MIIPEITQDQLEILNKAGVGEERDYLSLIPNAEKDDPETNKNLVATQVAIDGLVEMGLLWDVLNDPKEAYSRRVTMAKLERTTNRKFRVTAFTEIGGYMFANAIPEEIN